TSAVCAEAGDMSVASAAAVRDLPAQDPVQGLRAAQGAHDFPEEHAMLAAGPHSPARPAAAVFAAIVRLRTTMPRAM
ncbi:MAG: hypothetical protein WBE54_18135, partial [Bradyrhizobium sp.]